MIRVKVCGLTDPLNAMDMVKAGADFIGYIFHRGSKRYVGDNPESGMFRTIPEKTRKVGVFVNENPDKVIEIANRFGIDMVQLHGQEPVGYCRTLRLAGIAVIKAFGVSEDFDFNCLTPFEEACDFFLFDTQSRYHGGSGTKFRWGKLNDYNLDKPFFLSGGIGPGDIQKIREFRHKSFYAADINSRFETAPGIKNAEKVNTFIHDIKTCLS
jgi:phosphoribosylanthranilate isomerase